MNKAVKAGEIFQLRELVPYQQGKIVNMDVLSNSKMKFVIMSFDAGTGLAEHAAPGEALIFALEGEGTIGYEGTEHTIRAGENPPQGDITARQRRAGRLRGDGRRAPGPGERAPSRSRTPQ